MELPSSWVLPFWSMTALALALLTLAALVRSLDQRRRDRQRCIYHLSFPAGLESDQVRSFIAAISGSLRPLPVRFLGTSTVAFEVLSTDRGLIYRLRVPASHADYVTAQLRALVPGIRVAPEEDLGLLTWTRVVELGQTNITRRLRISDPEPVATSLLASMQGLDRGEALLVQWVIAPATPARPPRPPSEHFVQRRRGFGSQMLAESGSSNRDAIADQRKKLEEPNLHAVLRVAATASHKSRARPMVQRVCASLASVRSPHTRFRPSFIFPAGRLAGRINRAGSPLIFPARLASSELVPLIAWPLGEPHIAGLPVARSRHLPAPSTIPTVGRLLARSTFPGNERLLAISPKDSLTHLYAVGPTGVGKTALLANLAAQDMASGAGVVVIESKGDPDGDLFHEALAYVPRGRIEDVLIMDVTDAQWPVGFNVLTYGLPQVVASDLQTLFDALYGGRSGIRMPEALYHGIMTLLTSQAASRMAGSMTFVDLVPLFLPMNPDEQALADTLIRGLQDPYIRSFWDRVQGMRRGERERFFEPVMDRIWQLNHREEIRRIIGQSNSAFDMRDVLRSRKILLVNLAGLGEDIASLVGTLLMNALWNAVKSGACDPERPSYLYLDEFQNYLSLPISPGDLLTQARSFGLSMNIAHQHLGQLTSDVLQAVLANARSKVVFQAVARDARLFASEFGKRVSEDDFVSLSKFEVICRLAGDSGVSEPVSGVTLPPAPKHGLEQSARAHSRMRYGRAAVAVDEEIAARRLLVGTSADDLGRRRPKLGGQEWSEG
jgi:hypothetical protein